MHSLFSAQQNLLERVRPIRISGRVHEVTGLTVVAENLPLPIGAGCDVLTEQGESLRAQVIALRGDKTLLMMFAEPTGIARGNRVTSIVGNPMVAVGDALLGRVIGALGQPIDGHGEYTIDDYYALGADSPAPFAREPIESPLATGVRALDAFLTIGEGQRMGIFAGTGVGKSVLMGMITRMTEADVNVVALIGERGREVGDFVRNTLGEEGLKRSVVIASTSDESPLSRVRAGFVATAVAEYFRDRGKRVLLLLDSITRIAHAQRQIGLAAGEPPASRAYPPSVFALLPKLMERCGRTTHGSITGLYTVLVDADDVNDPIGDAARGILDGHVWLARQLANRGHYPAISVLESISRVMSDVAGPTHTRSARTLRSVLATWAEIEDMVNLGAYTRGTNREFDLAVEFRSKLEQFLRQDKDEEALLEDSREQLYTLAAEIEAYRAQEDVKAD